MFKYICLALAIALAARAYCGSWSALWFVVKHPLRVSRSVFKDLHKGFENIKKNEIPIDSGGIILIGGLFGTGKTANQVSFAYELFSNYSNVDIYSNVSLFGVKYVFWDNLDTLLEPVPDGRFRVFNSCGFRIFHHRK